MIICQVCGFEGTMLGRHIKAQHQLTKDDYQRLYPGFELTDKSLREKMSNSNQLKGKVVGSLEDRFGADKANEIKEKIGSRSGAARVGKARPQQGETLKATWEAKRDEWSKSIKQSFTPERRQKASDAAKRLIAERGSHHLQWGQLTAFESLVASYFELIDLTTTKQYHANINGTNRFFDLFIEELNMLVECDGEYWHTDQERIDIDRQKNQWAHDNGFIILRLSDKAFPARLTHTMSEENKQQCFDFITSQIEQTCDEMYIQAQNIIDARESLLE